MKPNYSARSAVYPNRLPHNTNNNNEQYFVHVPIVDYSFGAEINEMKSKLVCVFQPASQSVICAVAPHYRSSAPQNTYTLYIPIMQKQASAEKLFNVL